MKVLLAVCILAATASALLAEPEIKGSPKELAAWLDGTKSVSLRGEAEIKSPADQATVRLIVRTENKSLEGALRRNQEIREKIITSLKGAGLPAEAIGVLKFSSTPNYGVFGDKAKSYTVDNVVTIRVTKESEFQSVAEIVDTREEVHYDGIQFNQSEKEALKVKALAQACDRALEKKGMLEEKLGIKLKVKGFIEDATVTPELSPTRVERVLTSGLSLSKSPSEGVPSSFGEVTCKAVVTVEFYVEK